MAQVPPGLLGAALQAASAKQKALSTAGAALAKKSHPQTQPGIFGAPAPVTPPPIDYNQLIAKQLAQMNTAQSEVDASGKALAAANAQEMPTGPIYSPPDQPKPDIGGLLGAALAGIFAPKYAEGVIGGVGVTQQNAKDKFATDTATAQQQYKIGEDAYTTQLDNRQKTIDNAEKLNMAATRHVDSLDTTMSRTLTGQSNEEARAAALQERIQEAAQKEQKRLFDEKMSLKNFGRREEIHRDTLVHWGQQLGFQNTKLSESLAMQAASLSQRLSMFNVHETDAVNIANNHSLMQMVLQGDRDFQSNNRQAVTVAAEMQKAEMGYIGALSGKDPKAAAAAAAGYTRFMKAYGQKLLSSLSGTGINGQEGAEAVAAGAETISNSAGSFVPDPNADPSAKPQDPLAGMVDQLPPDATQGQSAIDFTKSLMGQVPGVHSAVNGGKNSTAQPAPEHAHGDPVIEQVQRDLPIAKKHYEEELRKNGNDPNKAWSVIKGMGYGPGQDREAELMRRALQRGGTKQPGKAKPPLGRGPRIAPQSPLPTLQQAGISPALLP